MPKSPIISLQGNSCYVQFGKYANGTLAMQAFVEETHEPYATLTINYEANWEGAKPYAKAFKGPVVVIKNYAENEGLLDDLVKANVITRGAYLAGSRGGVEACQLTPEWEAVANEQAALQG